MRTLRMSHLARSNYKLSQRVYLHPLLLDIHGSGLTDGQRRITPSFSTNLVRDAQQTI
jgi:hypothetical protein